MDFGLNIKYVMMREVQQSIDNNLATTIIQQFDPVINILRQHCRSTAAACYRQSMTSAKHTISAVAAIADRTANGVRYC